MQDTPQSNRLCVAIYGRCNTGKSSLFNAITGTEGAIVSPTAGTTTDPVVKAMELIPHGPITLIDTAGVGDEGTLGAARMKKTQGVLNRTDFALYLIDPADPGWEEYDQYQQEFAKRGVPHLVLLVKTDIAPAEALRTAQARVPGAMLVCAERPNDVEALKTVLCQALQRIKPDESMLAGLLPGGSVVVMVVPIDSEAPKGRLILPQVQLLRECLDAAHRVHVTTDQGLPEVFRELKRVDLVVTDSQAFGYVQQMVPPYIPLTSFSILMARQKSDIYELERGAKALATLKAGSRVLVAETCTHSHGHEDIGRVKLPRLLQKAVGAELDFTFTAGRDYPEDLSTYDAILHCGGCMVTSKEMQNRLRLAREAGVPITNYGLALAWCNGILARSMEILHGRNTFEDNTGRVRP